MTDSSAGVSTLLVSLAVLRKILILLNVDSAKHELLSFLYLTSSLMVAVVFVVCQYDLISVVFQLLGVQAFLEKKDKRFVFFFGIAFLTKADVYPWLFCDSKNEDKPDDNA